MSYATPSGKVTLQTAFIPTSTMSGHIRKLIGPAKARAQGYIEDTTTLLQRPLNDDVLDELEDSCEDLSNRVTRCLDMLTKCNDDWAAVLKDLQGDDRAAEIAEYDRVCDGPDGLVQILLSANDALAGLAKRTSAIRRRKTARLAATLPPQVSAPPVPTAVPPQP